MNFKMVFFMVIKNDLKNLNFLKNLLFICFEQKKNKLTKNKRNQKNIKEFQKEPIIKITIMNQNLDSI